MQKPQKAEIHEFAEREDFSGTRLLLYALTVMKFRRKRDLLSWNRFFFCALVISISCALLSSFSLSAFRRLGGMQNLHKIHAFYFHSLSFSIMILGFLLNVHFKLRSSSICKTPILPFVGFPRFAMDNLCLFLPLPF